MGYRRGPGSVSAGTLGIMSILVIGSINADLTVRVEQFPQPGETIIGRDAHIFCGGKGANQAVAAAVQGAPVAMVGAVGQDAYGKPSQELLTRANVDLSAVEELEGNSTGLAYICVDDQRENNIVVVPGANAAIDDTYVARYSAKIAEADIVLLQGEIPSSGIEEAMRLAEKHSTRVVINLAPVVDIDPKLFTLADPLIVNQNEKELLEKRLGKSLKDLGCQSVVVTLGSQGSVAYQGPEFAETVIPAAMATQVVDTVGAGDAFAGALTAALINGESLEEACLAGADFAAKVIAKPGAQQSYF